MCPVCVRKIEERRDDIDRARSNAEAAKQRLKAKIKDLQEQAQQLRTEVNDKRRACRSADVLAAERLQEVGVLEKKLQEGDRAYRKLLAKSKTAVDNAVAEVNKERDKEVRALSSTIEDQNEEIDRLTSALKDQLERTSSQDRAHASAMSRTRRHSRGKLERSEETMAEKEAQLEAEAGRLQQALQDKGKEARRTRALAAKTRALEKRNKQLSNRAKNLKRNRKNVKERERTLKRKMKEESAFFKPTRTLKPVEQLKKRQRLRREKEMKKRMKIAHERIIENFNFKGYGPMKFVIASKRDVESGLVTTMSMRPDTEEDKMVKKVLALRTQKGVSTVKVHEFHMLFPELIPSLGDLSKAEKEVDAKINAALKLDITEQVFRVEAESFVRWLVDHRGLVRPIDDELHLSLEIDGRGTGKSFHSVICHIRILNEGPVLFRNDRSYLLCMVAGKEGYDLYEDHVKPTLDQLKELQRNGLLRSDGQRVKVFIHWVADGKAQQQISGMQRFCDRGHHCLYCRMHSDRQQDLSKRWYIHDERFLRVGKYGQKKKDLIDFIPIRRRYSEGMHLVMRFLHDKLLRKAFKDILYVENDETTGLALIRDQMRSGKIKVPSFDIFIVKDENDVTSADEKSSNSGKWGWRTLSFSQTKRAAHHFDFVKCYKKNPSRGERVQKIVRTWIHNWSQIYDSWPGDANPEWDADHIYEQNVSLVKEMLEDDNVSDDEELLPGEDDHEPSLFPSHIVTPYAHTWINHVGEQFIGAKVLSKFFNDKGKISGGLAHARTDSLERKNLSFFHAYFQVPKQRIKN